MGAFDAAMRCPFTRYGQLKYAASHPQTGKQRRRDRDERVEEHRAVVVVGSECWRV